MCTRPTIRLTVSEALEKYFEETSTNFADITDIIRSEFSKTSIHDIDPETLTAFANIVSSRCDYITAKKTIDVIKKLYDWLIEKEYFVFAHPVKDITIHRFFKGKPVMSDCVLHGILNKCRKVNEDTSFTEYEYSYPILFMYLTGITIEELAVLEWSDIDYNSNHILIRKYLDRSTGNCKNYATLSPRLRDIFISDEIKIILEYLKEHSCSDYVVELLNGGQIIETVLQKEFDKIISEIKCDDYFTLEFLRTKAVEVLISKGIDTLLILQIMGLDLSEIVDGFWHCVVLTSGLEVLDI